MTDERFAVIASRVIGVVASIVIAVGLMSLVGLALFGDHEPRTTKTIGLWALLALVPGVAMFEVSTHLATKLALFLLLAAVVWSFFPGPPSFIELTPVYLGFALLAALGRRRLE